MTRTRLIAVTTVAAAMLGAAGAYAAFPRLNAAERAIGSAIGQLRAAPPIYGGHKAAAIHLLQRAWGELQAAKAFRR